jgi:tRNA nucleotidyltransferase (CCA-adding enzyme)
MHIILTHEQADFDALAALFGASCVLSTANPILPRRLNRNVRAFITLYGGDFPFIDPRDIPQQSIELVTLVDTQSLVTLKGMNSKTKIEAIDHHPRRVDTPDKWDLTCVNSGATTTYFVELLQEQSESLSAIQATLLLLGIYEDTGSLTYSATTPRDIKAAAWLVEQGASLQIAVEFLNPPLSVDQRETFDRLVASAETMDIHGHRIVLACGEITDASEEISTLAHKLRDFFDPDALFVLVSTNEGVRLVARSTTDDIDVSTVASKFNGGGHDRAAAALIRSDLGMKGEALLKETKVKLIDTLSEIIRPSITVNQVMSQRPQILGPETSAQEALRLMQRYGYEGFPVVENGQVVGLLTRRSVDRALSHKLNLTAASLMEAGAIYVHPNDSLQHLQALMTSSGWGQIPVVDSETGKIIGIVTRTDLLKNLPHQPVKIKGKNISAELKNTVLSGNLQIIQAVSDEAKGLHLPVYIVGGFVRDFLLGLPTLDFDIVVEGDAIALAKALATKHGGKITTHSRFGTAKWFVGQGAAEFQATSPPVVDLISSRQEFYEHPSALPTVERGSIKLDLHRRDFTINTLAIRLDGHHFGELHDYYGGLTDLEQKKVRVLHSLSFVDDPTRMLRAVRYEQRYDFIIEPRTLQLMDEARPLVSRLSSERVRHELDLILEEPRCASMLSRLDQLGLLKSIIPDLPWNDSLLGRLSTSPAASIPSEWSIKPLAAGIPLIRSLGYLIWLAPLPAAAIDTIQARLRLPTALYKALLSASDLLSDLASLRGSQPSVWVSRLEDIPLLVIYAVYVITNDRILVEYGLNLRFVHPFTDGHELRKLGLAPGPSYHTILTDLRAAWVDGKISSKEQEMELLSSLITKTKGL